jgi:choline dehydrogenase-like flavoprotein
VAETPARPVTGSPVDPVIADYVIVGGGTAGSVLAARLSEDPAVTVVLVEWGPSDEDEPRAGQLRRWPEMFGSEYDLDYRSVPQERGNSGIRQTRIRLLGGCSTANTMIAWRPPAADLDEWAALGATGWDAATLRPYYDRLLTPITPVAPQDRNPLLADIVKAAASALDVPERTHWNDTDYVDGAGFFEVGYTPADNLRSSASRAYLHPIMHRRPNLRLVLNTRVTRLQVAEGRVEAVRGLGPDGTPVELRPRREVVLCCGAIDTPRLLLLSGIGPAGVLRAAGVPVVHDLPGVGENLQDHADAMVVWETTGPTPPIRASGWDAGVLARVDGAGSAAARPDVVMLMGVETWGEHLAEAGYELPGHTTSLSPSVAKPASRGRVWITRADPEAPPALDYRSFTDPGGHDEAVIVAGLRMARRIAATEPMAGHVVREVFPGPEVRTDAELFDVVRRTHQTVYHVSGTARMGAAGDPAAVLDPQLRVRGLRGLRIVDASVFPTLTSVNPVGTVLMVAERAADLIRSGAGASADEAGR